jgi:hypothetical protein
MTSSRTGNTPRMFLGSSLARVSLLSLSGIGPMRTLRWALVVGSAGIAGSAGWSMAATQPSGVAVAVVQSAQANGQSGSRPLHNEAPVYSGDQIVTGPVGEAQVRFTDNTKLVVGPNSRMVIDAFVFNDDRSARRFSINAVRGSFRFITGSSPKDAYTITTPTSTIGIRGTEFDINVSGSGTTLALFSGSARVCDRATGRCIVQVGRCSVSTSAPGRAPALVRSARAQLDRLFRYIGRQTGLRREFRVDTSSCGIERTEAPRFEDVPRSVGSIAAPPPTSPPSTGGGGGSGGGNPCGGNCGNGGGGGGGNGTPNEGQGNSGSHGNSGNAPGHNK